MQINNILIGSDPEFFLFKEETPMSSIGIINGTKYEPEIVGEGYGLQKDNVLFEGNIPPAKTREEFISNMKQLKSFMNDRVKDVGYHIVSADSAQIPDFLLENDEAKQFGCAPYINAWTLEQNSPEGLENLKHRVAGFHIHIGYDYKGDFSSEFFKLYLVRAFDYFLVYPSRKIYNDPIRAKYYGDYGNFRLKHYGVECRSLGGFFTADKYLGWVYDQTLKAIEYTCNEDNIELLKMVKAPEDSTIQESYDLLGINLQEQLYEDNNTITINKFITEETV